MTFKQMIRDMNKNPGRRYDAPDINTFCQSAETLLMWFYVQDDKKKQAGARREIKKANWKRSPL